MRRSKSKPGSAVTMKPVEFLVLAVLKEGPLHGYGIVQEVTERTGGRVRIRPGNLYRVLDRMMEAELLEVAERKRAQDLGDERRTYYRITPAGRKAVLQEAEMLAEIAADVIGSKKGAIRPA